MNAVFQQLYMQPGLPEVGHMFAVCCLPLVVTRGHLLCVSFTHSLFLFGLKAFLSIEDDTDQPEESVFYQVQSLFGHLMESKLQYYVPENFWKVADRLSHWESAEDSVCCAAYFSRNQGMTYFTHANLCLLQIFKMWNKELYVREQQDAYEFFTSLVDQLDEHLKVELKPTLTHQF